MRRKIANILLIVIVLFTTITIIGISNNKQKSVKTITVAKKEYFDHQYPVNDYRQALLETAHAYHRKGEFDQYDSYRINHYFSPEDATSQNYIFSVCSTFAQQAYYQAFEALVPRDTGDVHNYAKKVYDKYGSGKYVFYHDGCKTRSTKAEKIKCIREINEFFAKDQNACTNGESEDTAYDHLKCIPYNLLEPGDLIVINRVKKEELDNNEIETTTGHVMIVDSIDDEGIVHIIESGGSNLNYSPLEDKYEKNGAIRNDRNAQNMIVREAKRTDTQLYGVSIVRLITDDLKYPDSTDVSKLNTLDITPAAETRLQYPDIDIDKTYKINNTTTENQVVQPGDEIEYTIKITNNSDNPYNSIIIKEEIPDYTTIGDTINYSITSSTTDIGGAISADFADKYVKTENGKNIIEFQTQFIPANETFSFEYSVKVDNNQSNIGKYIESMGTTGNIKNRTINLKIGTNLSEENQSKIVNAYNSLKSAETTNGIDFIRKIYNQAGLQNLNAGLSNLYINGVPMNSIDLVNIGERVSGDISAKDYYKYVINPKAKGMLLYNYYGVRMTNSSESVEENIANHVIYAPNNWPRYFLVPDYESRARSLEPANLLIGDLVYHNDKVYLYLGNNTLVGRNNNTIEEFNDTTTPTSTVLLRNIVLDNYIVLRPSIQKKYNVTTKHLIKGTTEEFDSATTTEIVEGGNYNTSISSKANPASYYDITIPDNANGIVTGDTVVTYYYKKKTGKIIVKHLDKDGNKLAEPTEETLEYGKNYTTSPVDSLKDNYTVKIPAGKSGLVNKNEIEVIYYYYPKENQKVEFETEIEGDDTVKEAKDTYNYKISVTAKYTDYVDKSKVKIVYNLPYEINEAKSTLDGGEYNADKKTITWEEEIDVDSYTQDTHNFEKNITVQYRNIDYEQGSMLSTLRLESNDDVYMDSSMTHQTEFEIPAKIIIKYLDEAGNELMESEEINDLVGNPIEIKEKEIEGYKIVSSPTQTKYTLEEQTLVYRYAKNEVVAVENTAKNYPLYIYVLSIIGIIVGGLVIASTKLQSKKIVNE